jgi:O-antigen ligase
MLVALKEFLRSIFFPLVYASGAFVTLYAIFKDAMVGFVLFFVLIPQPNIYYKFHNLPLGEDFLDILFIAIVIGIFVQKKKVPYTPNTTVIIFFMLLSYFSLWNSALRFDLPLPISYASHQLIQWKNFAQMIFIYFIVLALVRNEEQQKKIFLIMAAVIFFIALRNYRNFSGGSSFSYDKRVGGPFEKVGLGATHYGAFIAHFSVAFLGMSFFEKDTKKKLFFLGTFLLCLHPLFFSYSRGAWLGALLALTYFGLLRKRIILVMLLALGLFWQTVLPVSVVDRITSTETASGQLESSANTRLLLWSQAETIFKESPIIGLGWESFGLSVSKMERIHNLTDTHNYYMKTLCDRGILGLLVLLLIFAKAFRSGLKLYRTGNSQFQKGLGFCFMGTVLACMVTNLFGDRFTYFILGSYFWIFWGIVDRGVLLSQAKTASDEL